MATEEKVWRLSQSQWERLLERARNPDPLQDGAYVLVDSEPPELCFYATALNHPQDFRYPFQEELPGVRGAFAFIGVARHVHPADFVEFEAIVYAAAQALKADYESDVSAMDYVEYEQAVDRAVRGTPADVAWLRGEFDRLMRMAGL